MKEVFSRRSEFQLNDSAEFYFDNVERLSADGYLPTTDDVLRSRVRTTGIVQSDFEIKKMPFSMFDVGGQRNERRKWIHCFDNVDAVVFVASLSEFDQNLYEDETKNRLDEALELFQQIVGSKWFLNTSMILFLNKKDLFEKKLGEGKVGGPARSAPPARDHSSPPSPRRAARPCAAPTTPSHSRRDAPPLLTPTPIAAAAPLSRSNVQVFANFVKSYSGPNEMKPCAEHAKELFLARNKNKDKSIYTHITTAIDTSNVKFVFQAVVAMILEENLKGAGLV
jgi:hypothetical protein